MNYCEVRVWGNILHHSKAALLLCAIASRRSDGTCPANRGPDSRGTSRRDKVLRRTAAAGIRCHARSRAHRRIIFCI